MPNRRFLLSLAAAAALSACGTPPALAAGNLVDVQVVDRASHSVLPDYRHRGLSYVAGRPGDRYAVRLSNRSGQRVLVVLSVDGVNAITGETASTSQTGYVLAPYQTADITGWRKSDREAAAFYFTALPDSYAARTDRPDNVGVIGAAVFRERVQPPPPPPPRAFEPPYSGGRFDREQRAESSAVERQAQGAAADAANQSAARAAPMSPAAPAPSLAQAPREREAAKAAEKLGTGHGEREYSPMGRTQFERASSSPNEVVQIRYDSYANLQASGVIPSRRVPDPFPGFVRDPA